MDKISATTIADTVAVAIHCLGFTPTSSVVLMLLDGHTVAANLRIDANPGIPAGVWASEVARHVHRLDMVTGVLLLSFEDGRAMSSEQYRALDMLPTLTRRPVRRALRITGGFISDYDGDGAEKIPFSAVESSNAGPALIANTESYAKLAADIPPCSPAASTSPAASPRELEGSLAAARTLDCTEHETRTMVCTRFVGVVMGYQCTRTITPQEGARLARTCTNKGIRGLLFASLATTRDDMDSVSAALMGECAPDGWDFFKDGADAIYTALKRFTRGSRAELPTRPASMHGLFPCREPIMEPSPQPGRAPIR